jgi:hypothetical protein
MEINWEGQIKQQHRDQLKRIQLLLPVSSPDARAPATTGNQRPRRKMKCREREKSARTLLALENQVGILDQFGVRQTEDRWRWERESARAWAQRTPDAGKTETGEWGTSRPLMDLLTERTRKQNQNSAPAGCADRNKTMGKMNLAEEPSWGPAGFTDGEAKNEDKQWPEETDPIAHISKSNWLKREDNMSNKISSFIENQREYNWSTVVIILHTLFD